MTRFRTAFLALAAVSAVLVFALPAGAKSGATTQASAKKVTAVAVTAGSPSEFKFKLSKARVPKGVVTFTVTNVGAVPHDFKIGGKTTKLLNPKQSAKLTVTFAKAGKYPYLCTVPSHAVLGMKGTLTVF